MKCLLVMFFRSYIIIVQDFGRKIYFSSIKPITVDDINVKKKGNIKLTPKPCPLAHWFRIEIFYQLSPSHYSAPRYYATVIL